MPVKQLDEHVDATKVGAYCASKNGSFVLPKPLDGSLEQSPYLRSRRHALIVNEAFRATLAEDVMIH